jgi:hypothetical protein
MITPDELRRIAEEKEMAQLREALEKKRKADEERHHLHDAFMADELVPDVFERASRLVKGAAERGEREVLAIRFPSEYCTDGGRAINSFEPDWAESLTGFAKRIYEFWLKELEPGGYKLHARSWISRAACRATSGSFSGGRRQRLGGPCDQRRDRTARVGLPKPRRRAILSAGSAFESS